MSFSFQAVLELRHAFVDFVGCFLTGIPIFFLKQPCKDFELAGGTVEIVNDPNDAANKVVKFVKKPGDGEYFGTTITGLGGSVVLTATEKTVTMRVYSPTVGTNFLLKFEGGTGGPATTEKDAATGDGDSVVTG